MSDERKYSLQIRIKPGLQAVFFRLFRARGQFNAYGRAFIFPGGDGHAAHTLRKQMNAPRDVDQPDGALTALFDGHVGVLQQ